MKAIDIMESLTDMDDDVLMRAEIDPPRRKPNLLRHLQRVAAACLVVVLIFSMWLGVEVIAADRYLQWKIRYRENEILYLLKSGADEDMTIPSFEPTWMPDGYTLLKDRWGQYRDRELVYQNTEDSSKTVWFHYVQITKPDRYYFSDLDLGCYEAKKVDINGCEGELYTFNEDPSRGKLVWIHKEQFTILIMDFDELTAEEAIHMAESVRLIAESDSEEGKT